MATYESKRYATIPIAATQVADGSVTNSEYQYINTLASNAQTQITARAPLAGATFTGGVRINDSQNLNIGSATDLVISHDTNNSKINNTTGELRIGADTIKLMNQAEDETQLSATADGAVSLYHNNVIKAATGPSGLNVTGSCVATTFSGSGSGLSNLNAADVAGQFSATAVKIDYDNLPTSDPNVKGRFYLQDYGSGKTLMVSDG